MNGICSMTLKNLEGALERVLGVIRFRGFQVVGMQAHSLNDNQAMMVQFELNGSRNMNQLAKHLDKLYEVQKVHSQAWEHPVEAVYEPV